MLYDRVRALVAPNQAVSRGSSRAEKNSAIIGTTPLTSRYSMLIVDTPSETLALTDSYIQSKSQDTSKSMLL